MTGSETFDRLAKDSLRRVKDIANQLQNSWGVSKAMAIAFEYYLAQAYNRGVADTLKEIDD